MPFKNDLFTKDLKSESVERPIGTQYLLLDSLTARLLASQVAPNHLGNLLLEVLFTKRHG